MVSTLALPPKYTAQVVKALSNAKRPVLVWLQFQDCAGNSESMLRSSHPSVAEVVLDLLSWEYHEIIMAGAGKQAEAALQRVIREERGKYIAVVEGAIPLADDGVYCTIGGRTALILRARCAAAPWLRSPWARVLGMVDCRRAPESDRRRWLRRSGARIKGGESRGLSAQSGQHRSGADPLSHVQ